MGFSPSADRGPRRGANHAGVGIEVGSHTLMLEFTGVARLALELLAQLIQQLRQTGVRSGHHPAMSVIHGAGGFEGVFRLSDVRELSCFRSAVVARAQ